MRLGRLGMGLTALAAVAPSAGTQAPPVFRAEVGATYVDVVVSSGGRSVPGLAASNFELKDNGVLQQVELVSAESRPLQAVLVFDASSSVAGEKVVALRAAGAAFLDGLRAKDEAALVAFSEEITWLAPPTADKEAVRTALGRLRPTGATAAFDALYAALALSDSRGRALVVLFTDGDDNTSILGERQLRTVAERSNAVVHVVGLRGATPTAAELEADQVRALREIAEGSGGRFWTAESPPRLREAFAAIAASMGERYVLRYEPQGMKREGWHQLAVRLRGAKGTVQARRAYWVASR
jgi:VWFA-related protein